MRALAAQTRQSFLRQACWIDLTQDFAEAGHRRLFHPSSGSTCNRASSRGTNVVDDKHPNLSYML
jgi:hypothetical protein